MIVQILLVILAASMVISWIQPSNFSTPQQEQTQQLPQQGTNPFNPSNPSDKSSQDQSQNKGIENYELERDVDEELNDEFTEVLQQVFVLCEQDDYWDMHYTFEDPQKYGLDPATAKVSLGSFLPQQQDIDLTNQILEMITPYDEDKLSWENYYFKEQLEWECNLSLKLSDHKFDYLSPIWDKTYSLPETLESNFSTYDLYSEEDIPYLIELLGQLPDYMDQAYAYTKEQANQNLLYMDKEYLIGYIDTLLGSGEQDSVQENFNEQLQSLGLNGAQSMEYHKQITDALNAYYYPAMQRCKEIVEEFGDQAAIPISFAQKPNGKEYYELLMQYQSGTTKTVGQMESELQSTINTFVEQLQNLYMSNPNFLFGAGDPEVNLGDIQSQLNILKTNYTKAFPEIGEVEIDIDAMNEADAMDENVLAYTQKNPVGSNKPFTVRYNPNSTEQHTLDFYQTLAHETIPGHVYSWKYRDDYFKHDVQYLFDYLYYLEGWAEYASDKALNWINLDDTEREGYLLEKHINDLSILLADIEINYNGMSQEEAEENYGFDADAYASVISTAALFFSYDYGSLQFAQMEKEARTKIANFNEVDFNNQMLRYGQINYELLEEVTQNYIEAANAQN